MTITHVFQHATVTRIIKETADTRTFVLAPHETPFNYRAGQYCTFQVRVDGEDLYRSYSMSSAPETDRELMTTVKRVPGGKVSNWILDNVVEGDELTMTRAAGTFCLDPTDSTDSTDAPLLGFTGGSGITPVLSLVKSTLAGTDRRVRLLCADRDRDSAIFEATLAELAARHPDRLCVQRHYDSDDGLLDAGAVDQFVAADAAADWYLCGPEGFMALVRSVHAARPDSGRLFVEEFDTVAAVAAATAQSPAETRPAARSTGTDAPTGTVTIQLGRKEVSVPLVSGETLLESARRAGLKPPFNCELGNCGTCMARITEGSATMRANNVLNDSEVADGYILTCQGVPDGSVTVCYEE